MLSVKPRVALLGSLCAIVLALGCSAESDGEGGSGGAGGTSHDASAEGGSGGTVPDSGPDVEAGDAETGPAHPCEQAPFLPSSTETESVTGTIDPAARQADHYRFEASAGEWVELSAIMEVNYGPGPEGDIMKDSALTLMNADGTAVIASWDDSAIAHAGAADFATRIEADGTYCVRVEHGSSWSNTPPLRPVKLDYKLSLTRLATVPDLTWDVEPNDTDAEATPVVFMGSQQLFVIAGELDSQDDVDVYRVPAGLAEVMQVTVLAGGAGGPGVNGTGSTLLSPDVSVATVDGKVLTRTQIDAESSVLIGSTEVGQEHLITIRRKPGAQSSHNDAYFVFGATFSELIAFEAETGAGQNDAMATAESTEEYAINGVPSFYQIHHASGLILETGDGTSMDVDYRSLKAEAFESLDLFCHALKLGSGLVAPRFAILNAQGEVLRESVETPDRQVIWGSHYDATEPALVLPETGTYYLRVTADDVEPAIAGRNYVCLLYSWAG